MSKIHIGPHTRRDDEVDPHPATRTFDREINLKAIAWTVGILVAVAIVAHFVVYGLIKGMNRFDDRREPRPSPVAAANEQPPPPLPHLQTTPEGDMKQFREEEDRLLGRASWVNQQEGRVRIPIDLAMEIVAGRGLGPEVVGGTPGAVLQTQPQVQQQPQAETAPPQERR